MVHHFSKSAWFHSLLKTFKSTLMWVYVRREKQATVTWAVLGWTGLTELNILHFELQTTQ